MGYSLRIQASLFDPSCYGCLVKGDTHKTYDYRINNTNIDLHHVRHGISVTGTDVAPGKTSLVVRSEVRGLYLKPTVTGEWDVNGFQEYFQLY